MKELFLGCCLALAFAFSGAQAKDTSVVVDNDFWEGDVTWDGGYGRAYDFRWYVFEQGGLYVLCGAGQFLDATTRSNTVDLLRKGKLLLNGKPILTDLTFFSRLKKSQPLVGASATCRSTGTKPRGSSDEVSLEISGRGRF